MSMKYTLVNALKIQLNITILKPYWSWVMLIYTYVLNILLHSTIFKALSLTIKYYERLKIKKKCFNKLIFKLINSIKL